MDEIITTILWGENSTTISLLLVSPLFHSVIETNFIVYKTKLNNKPYSFSLKRQYEVIIWWIRIRHSTYTHSCLYKGEQLPESIICNCRLTVQHIFYSFQTFPGRSLLFGNVDTMLDLSTVFKVHVLLQFLQECDFNCFIRLHLLHNFCQILYLLIFMSIRQIGREMMPCVKENNRPSSQNIVSLDLEEK